MATVPLHTPQQVREVPRLDDTLRRRVQMFMADGTLPSTIPVRTRFRLGSDRSCALCDQLIVSSESEVEVHFEHHAFAPYIFHGHCYALWFAESFGATLHVGCLAASHGSPDSDAT